MEFNEAWAEMKAAQKREHEEEEIKQTIAEFKILGGVSLIIAVGIYFIRYFS